MWFSIEGSIGSGKTSIISKLEKEFSDYIHFIKEPVEEWEPYLNKFYEDNGRYALMMQLKVMQSFRKHEHIKNKCTERSLFTSKNVFANMLYHSSTFDPLEYELYLDIMADVSYPDFFIYLRTTPDTCHMRIRNRKNDKTRIPKSYLEELHKRHENVFMHGKSVPWTFVVDANQNIESVYAQVKDIVHQKLFCIT